ncbi:hypothetical protein PFISCL1PPCAC_19181, partial [Pristionchus fissidentatus]
STLLTFVNNFTHVSFGIVSLPLTSTMFCSIREMIMNRQCKMQSLSVLVEYGIAELFLKECFGVTINDDWSLDTKNRTYLSLNAQLELYSSNPLQFLDLRHFNGNFETYIGRAKNGKEPITQNEISFSLCNEEYVNEKKKTTSLIEFDYPY